VSHSSLTTDTREFIYRVDAQNRLTDANAAWYDFARENGSHALDSESVIGCPLWDFISDQETRHLFQIVLAKVRQTGRPVTLSYRCDAPDLRRFMQLEIRPLAEAGVEFCSRIVRQESRPHVALLDDTAPRTDTFLNMCAWCKKVALPDESWVEVEQAVERLKLFEEPVLPQISHGICPACKSEVDRTLRKL
jgi:PAS fold